MKISLEWLSEYVEIAESGEKIAEILSDLGFPCEGIEQYQGDTVLDVEVTSNRGDCLGHIGVAREFAAGTGRELKLPEFNIAESETLASDLVKVSIESPELCGRYTARLIQGVKVGPSPDWMVKRLEAVGMRSVSNVVDATNYAMLESGQPPHAFDFDTISDGTIIVRKAKAGEQIVSIDSSKCELDENMLVIADSQRPVAIAGVMGGLDTEVSDKTVNILLEEAHFDPVTVRTASRKLTLPSEASYRFERIVDIERIDWASQRTAQLITQVAGGSVAKGVVDVYPSRPEKKTVTMRISRLNKLLGIEVPTDDVMKILSLLHFEPGIDNGGIVCVVPSWRSDIYREVDLIEEVARVYGYDKVPVRSKIEVQITREDERQKLKKQIDSHLNGIGFYETVNVTFVDSETADLFCDFENTEYLSVKDVSRKSANLLRQNLTGSLLGVLKNNLNMKNRPCRIYEVADTFVPGSEHTVLGLAYDGDYRELKGSVESLVTKLDKNSQMKFVPVEIKGFAGAAQIMINGAKAGFLGVISDEVKGKYDFKDVVPCTAELDLEILNSLTKADIKLKPIPRFPAIERDLSVVVDSQLRWEAIEQAVISKGIEQLEEVRFVDIYQGKGISSDKKSVTLSLCFRDEDGTMTHEIVDQYQQEILSELKAKTGAELRSV